MRQLTLISLYGPKFPEFEALIVQCQKKVGNKVGNAFDPYEVQQIHATLVGLERTIGSAKVNANYLKRRNLREEMDFEGFFHFLRYCGNIPFEVQIGGFQNREYPFRSRDQIPYDRSFSIQGDKVVLIGWPLRGEPFQAVPAAPEEWVREGRIYPRTLDVIRHAAQGFGILHDSHRALTDVDNDLYFRIGLVDPSSLTTTTRQQLETQIRQFLSTQGPLIIQITLKDVFVAHYIDDRLPPKTTNAWSLDDEGITGEFVANLLYQSWTQMGA